MNTTVALVVSFSILGLVSGRAADADAEKTITRTFNVQSGGTISLTADQGDIEVLSGKLDSVEIVVERKITGGSESAAKRLLEANKVTFSQDGNDIQVESKTPKRSSGIFSREPNLNSHFRITLPRRFNVSLNTSGGNIDVKQLDGTVDAKSAGGNLNFEKIHGAVDARTSGGNVKASDCSDKLAVQTSGGNIVIKNFTGPAASADTSGGNVDVLVCSGKLQVKTSGGNIDLEEFTGSSAYADTSGGAISIGLDKQPTGDCWFHTSGGNIVARLVESVAMNLNAATDGGSVSSDLPVTVQGKMKEGKLEGKINGGGPLLSLKTSGGDIRISKK